MDLATNLASLFRRDLTRLVQQIDAFPNDEMLWQVLPGVTNSAGNLALHLEGNLREYVGRQIGGRPYQRTRNLEFSSKGLARKELVARITEVRDLVPAVIDELTEDRMEAQFPEVVLERPLSIQGFLIHLYGHLNWHLGEMDYLRRVLSGNGAIPRASL